MTHLDPPAAAARRQYVLDRMAEDLVGWGCPPEHAEPRARQLLDRALDGGYALPAALDGPPDAGRGSTPAGRVRAHVLFAHRLIGGVGGGETRCACGQWHGPSGDHDRHVAAMLVAAGVATASEQQQARPQRHTGAPNTPPAVPQDPPGAHRGAEGVDQ